MFQIFPSTQTEQNLGHFKKLQQNGIPPKSPDALKHLLRAVTGFDIDPVAAQFAKVNWVATNAEWIEFNGSVNMSIPMYNADSLISIAPIFKNFAAKDDAHLLTLGSEEIQIPEILISPQNQQFKTRRRRVRQLLEKMNSYPEFITGIQALF